MVGWRAWLAKWMHRNTFEQILKVFVCGQPTRVDGAWFVKVTYNRQTTSDGLVHKYKCSSLLYLSSSLQLVEQFIKCIIKIDVSMICMIFMRR